MPCALCLEPFFPATGNQRPVSSIQYRVSSIQYRASSIEHPASSIQHRVSSIEHRLSSHQKPETSMPHPWTSPAINAYIITSPGISIFPMDAGLWDLKVGRCRCLKSGAPCMEKTAFFLRWKKWRILSQISKIENKHIKQPGYLERTSVLDFVGAASSRDRFNSRLEAAPTGVFFS